MKKLAIIGASHFQNPLILKAKEKGIETHVFAWQCGDVGEKTADYFYPYSIVEKESILSKCREIGIDGICSIGSDLANITVAYVAQNIGLCSNSIDCVEVSTNKHAMRNAFKTHGDPSPQSRKASSAEDACNLKLEYPVIVKPADRSGSRGITKVTRCEDLPEAISRSLSESFEKVALVEEFVEGREFSVEYLSWEGEHTFLSITEKFTTGAPMFIETGHLEPARISQQEEQHIKNVVCHALDSLGVRFGASHSEVKIDEDGTVKIIEIGSRMGGDCIGSDLVKASTGYDFVEGVIDVALGKKPKSIGEKLNRVAAIRFIFSSDDLDALHHAKQDPTIDILFESPISDMNHSIVDSSTRFGYFIFAANSIKDIESYLPEMA